jgi:putative membrane protein
VKYLLCSMMFLAALATGGTVQCFAQAANDNSEYLVAINPRDNLGTPGTDEAFVARGLDDGNAAIIFSKLALTKSENPEVKAFAQKVIDKHIAIGGGLVQDAKAMKVQIPKGLDSGYMARYQQLSKLSGNDFDKLYLASLLSMQHDDFGDMQDASRSSKVPHIQTETEKDLSILGQLDSEAEKLSKKLGGAHK